MNDNNKIKMYKVYPGTDCNPHTEDTLEKALESVKGWVEEAEEGAEIKIKTIKMSQEEYDNLPEWDGP